MPKNSELTEADRGKILGLRTGGSSISKIFKTLKIPRFATKNSRPKAINDDNKRILKEIIRKDNKHSADKV